MQVIPTTEGPQVTPLFVDFMTLTESASTVPMAV